MEYVDITLEYECQTRQYVGEGYVRSEYAHFTLADIQTPVLQCVVDGVLMYLSCVVVVLSFRTVAVLVDKEAFGDARDYLWKLKRKHGYE